MAAGGGSPRNSGLCVSPAWGEAAPPARASKPDNSDPLRVSLVALKLLFQRRSSERACLSAVSLHAAGKRNF